MTPTITVCTDASHNQSLDIASWACYIRTPDQTIQQGGIFREPVKNSYWAERLGMANALWILDQQVHLEDYKLVAYCDNVAALRKAKLVKTPASAQHQKILANNKWWDDNIGFYLEKANSFETRHVKGHLAKSKWGENNNRQFMNHWCDKQAKKLMKDYLRTEDLTPKVPKDVKGELA